MTTAANVPVASVNGHAQIVSPAPRAAWRVLLDQDPDAMPTQTPEWTDWLCNTRGYADASRLYLFPDGRQLLLPLVARHASRIRLTEESMPYGFGYGGPLVPGGRPTEDEAGTVLADLARRPVVRASLVPNPVTAGTWATAIPAAAHQLATTAHVLDLDGGFDHVWAKRYRPDARRNVRRALKHSLDVRSGTDEGIVEAYAELNRRSVDRWAAQRGQPRWLARLVDQRRDRVGQLKSALGALGPMVAAWAAYLDGEPVAVNVALRFRAHTYPWLSAMDRDLAHRTQAGSLLQSLSIEDACRSGARWFHLGESEPGSGVEMFKERFGAVPVAYTALRFERLPLTAAEHHLRSAVSRLTALQRRDRETGQA